MKHFKGNFKLIISLIITAIIIVTVVAINIKETNTYAADFTDGSVTYTYTASSNKLAIAGSGAVTNKWKTNDNLKNYVTTITQITIAKTITSIEDSAFEGCTSLQTVAFNSSSTCTNIGNNAFKGCTSLTNIKDGSTNNQIPAKVTTIGQSAFANCTSLQNITLKNAHTIGIEAFNNCSPTLSLAITSTQKITYTIPQGGVYRIEAHGGRGPSVTVEGSHDDKRTGDGAKGGKATGYIQLNKNDELKTEFYAGGEGNTNKSAGATYTSKGGDGGKGIGIKLGEEDKPFIAAGGGSGASTQGECSECHEFHGQWESQTTYNETIRSASTTGEDGEKWYITVKETSHDGNTKRYIGGAGGGGGYPYGGGTYEGGSMQDCRCLCWILLCWWSVSRCRVNYCCNKSRYQIWRKFLYRNRNCYNSCFRSNKNRHNI